MPLKKILSNACELIKLTILWHCEFWCAYIFKYAVEVSFNRHLKVVFMCKLFCNFMSCQRVIQECDGPKNHETTAKLQIFLVASNLFTINGCLKLAKFQLSFSSLKVWMGFLIISGSLNESSCKFLNITTACMSKL